MSSKMGSEVADKRRWRLFDQSNAVERANCNPACPAVLTSLAKWTTCISSSDCWLRPHDITREQYSMVGIPADSEK